MNPETEVKPIPEFLEEKHLQSYRVEFVTPYSRYLDILIIIAPNFAKVEQAFNEEYNDNLTGDLYIIVSINLEDDELIIYNQ